MARVAAIVLAAGESRRMGFPKPLLRIDGTTFIEQTLSRILKSAPEVIVVLGAHADRVRAAIPSDPRIKIVLNRKFLRGQLSSLRAGLLAIDEIDKAVDGAMVHLADHPMVKAETFAAVIDRYDNGGAQIVIARHAGRRGHPVLFDRSIFKELIAADDSAGARTVVAADPDRVAYVEVDDPGVVLDLDTPADLARAGLLPPPTDAEGAA
jgi:molybdenum cofactor cytidylyltransferase